MWAEGKMERSESKNLVSETGASLEKNGGAGAEQN